MFKLPVIPFYKIERVVRILPIIKEVFVPNNDKDSKTNKLLHDTIWNKKAEICKLREKIKDLEKCVWDLEENLDNCRHEITVSHAQISILKEHS